MAKIRIHELAKELSEKKIVTDSKSLNNEIVALLTKKGVDVKNHMSSVEDGDADYVRNYFSKKAETVSDKKPDDAKASKSSKSDKPVKPAKSDDTEKNSAKNNTEDEVKNEKNSKNQSSGNNAAESDADIADNRTADYKKTNEKNAASADNQKSDSEAKSSKHENAEKQNASENQKSANNDKAEGNRQNQGKGNNGASRKVTGKLVDRRTGETIEYWVASDGRLVAMNGHALPFVKTPDGRIQKLNGKPIMKKDNPQNKPETPVKNVKETEATAEKEETIQNTPAETKEEVKPVAEEKVEKPVDNGPQPKIVGNIFESLNEAKRQEQAARERRAQQHQNQGNRENRGDFRRNDRNNDRNSDDRGNRPFNRDGQQSRDGQNGNRPFNRDGQNRPYGQRDNRNGDDRGNRPFNRDGQQPRDGQNGNKPYGDRNNRPFGDRNQDNRSSGNRFSGPSGFQDKDKDEDNSRRFASKKPSKPSPDSSLKSELGAQINKNDRAGKFKNKGKDKKDKRDYDEETMLNPKKDPNRKGAFQKPVAKTETVEEEEIKTIVIPEVITIKDLADKMKQNTGAILKKLFLAGKMYNQNSEISFEEAEEIALEYEIICEKEQKVNLVEEMLKDIDDDPETLVKRPPVVCVMGHVDHGKTSLLDAIRSTNVTAREAGGITQAIGAYMVEINGQKITFLDTPGHEAFTSMRMRGAKSTDIAILVVAADDGVMPQTIEAINHAKAANVQIIVAVNKIDKPGANVERVKQELTEYGLVAEDWGGDTVFVPVSAKTHEGIENLLEMVILTADVLELKANPNRKARGIVIEAERDKGKGCVATVLVQKGTLNVGEYIAIGATHGRIRAMIDDNGRRVKTATPSTPVEIQGLDEVPYAGEVMIAVQDEKEARTIAEAFIAQNKERLIAETKARLSLDGLFSQIQAGNVKELNLIIKADVMGSVEAVKQSLEKLSNEEVVVRVIHGGVGNINESDVNLAGASNAIIIGFNVKPDNTAKDIAEHEGVEIKLYKVIYNAIEDIEEAMKGMYKPVYEERVIGHAEVRMLFKASGVGVIAGSFVLDGKIVRGCKARITREGNQIFDGPLASLKRFKDDVKEVSAGYECGLVFEKFTDLAELDQVEFYDMVEVPRK